MRILTLFFVLLALPLSAQMVGDVDYGLASYYSDEYHGATTSYGETYNRNDMVAAHKLYPYGSTVRVKNTENGKAVTVRVIDKGPFIRGRIIELSERAAASLGMIGKSTAEVELTLLSTPDQPARPAPRPDPVVIAPTTPNEPVTVIEPVAPSATEVPTRAASTAPTRTETAGRTAPVTDPAPASAPVATPAPAATVQTPRPARTVSNDAREAVKQTRPVDGKLATAPAFSNGVYHVRVLEAPDGQFGVQVGSFSTLESAMDKVLQLQGKYFDNILVQKQGVVREGTGKYKVILGPFEDQASAKNYAGDLKSRYKIAGFVVNLPE